MKKKVVVNINRFEAVLASILLLVSSVSFAQTKAFPGAEGYGKYDSGGRGTTVDGKKIFLDAQVVEVTNLEDYSEGEEVISGSFRWALAQQDTLYNGVKLKIPTTIVFRVGGVIALKRDIHTSTKHLTIAGQTALGNGICFKAHTVNLSGSSNVIVRHIRFRPGDEAVEEISCFRIENGADFIIDHCSFSWAIEENTHFSSDDNITVQWCMLTESLCNSIHKKGERGYAAQWGGEFASYHHNLLAHHRTRMPRVNGSNENDVYALVDYRNNVNYNWGDAGAMYGGEFEGTPRCSGYSHVNMVNNYFVPGPKPEGINFAAPTTNRGGVTLCGYAKWFVNGNVMHGNQSMTDNNWTGINYSKKDSIYSNTEFVESNGIFEDYSNYTQLAADAYVSVLENAGATLPLRDAHDKRVVDEVKGDRAIVRYAYTTSDGLSTPLKGTNSGIIDTQENLVSPEDREAGKDAWSCYQTIMPVDAPVDSDHDGMPDSWELSMNLNPNDGTDFRIITPSGYTWLEVYLAELTGYIIDYNKQPSEVIQTTAAFSKINIFPNPVNSELFIESHQTIHTINLYRFNGHLEMSNKIDDCNTILNLLSFPKGIYFVELITIEGEVFFSKILKQ